MKTLLVFLAGLFLGGFAGVLATCFCVSAGRGRDDAAEYKRYLRGVSDPRD